MDSNILATFEAEAREDAARWCENELRRLAPLAELDLELSDRNLRGSEFDLNERDVQLLLCVRLIEEYQARYKAMPRDVTPVIDFIGKTREKIVNVLASRSFKYLN
jgi:hypothetical protein